MSFGDPVAFQDTAASNEFERFWSLGYKRLLPIVPPGAPVSEFSSLATRIAKGKDPRGKTPGVKRDDGFWSSFDWVKHETTEADLTRWGAMGAGVGIKTGDGLVLIDADTLSEFFAGKIKQVIEKVFGFLPPVRVGRYPKAGYLVRVDGPFPYFPLMFGEDQKERVEILSDKKQFVAIGTHPVTKQPYRWPSDIPAYDDLPIVTVDKMWELLHELKKVLPNAGDVRERQVSDGEFPPQEELLGDLAMITAAVKSTPNRADLFPTYDHWFKYGIGIKAALRDHPDEAYDLWSEWSMQWPDATPDVVEDKWRSFVPPFRTGAAHVYSLARQATDNNFPPAEFWLDPEGDEFVPPENLSKPFGAPIEFTSFSAAVESALAVGARPLVKGLLDCGAMTVLYGESNVGKTFVALDLAFHIAEGMAWGGMRVAPDVSVVYVAAEGGRGARKRAAAIGRKYGRKGERFHFLFRNVNLLRADADLAPLIAAIKALGVPVGLIVIDTLSRAMSGGDENASTDMGAMVRHLDKLREATGAHLLAVHHSGKDRAKGARGHSLLRAATDTEIEVAERVIAVQKQRDLEGGWSSAFVLEGVELGKDPDGESVTSATVRLVADKAALPAGDATPHERDILDALTALEGLADDGKPGTAVADLVAHFEGRLEPMHANAVRMYLKRMSAKGLIRNVSRGRWAAREPDRLSGNGSKWTDCPENLGLTQTFETSDVFS